MKIILSLKIGSNTQLIVTVDKKESGVENNLSQLLNVKTIYRKSPEPSVLFNDT